MSYAAGRGHKEIFELLLATKDIDVNARTPDLGSYLGKAALSNAAEAGHTEIVELLLARNDIDVNAGELLGVAADHNLCS